MAWRLAKSLDKLRTQVNKEWPNRSKVSDGTIGDTAHSSRLSQHNPNSAGVVTAFDITHDPKNGADMNKLKEQLIKDSRTWYIIFNRRIWQNGKWTNYVGSNPHDKHLHISTKQDAKNYDNSKDWNIGGKIEDMITVQEYNELKRFYHGNNPNKAQLKQYVGKITATELTKKLKASPTYKTRIAQAKAGTLDVKDHLPVELRSNYKPPKSDAASNDQAIKDSLFNKIKGVFGK